VEIIKMLANRERRRMA